MVAHFTKDCRTVLTSQPKGTIENAATPTAHFHPPPGSCTVHRESCDALCTQVMDDKCTDMQSTEEEQDYRVVYAVSMTDLYTQR